MISEKIIDVAIYRVNHSKPGTISAIYERPLLVPEPVSAIMMEYVDKEITKYQAYAKLMSIKEETSLEKDGFPEGYFDNFNPWVSSE